MASKMVLRQSRLLSRATERRTMQSLASWSNTSPQSIFSMMPLAPMPTGAPRQASFDLPGLPVHTATKQQATPMMEISPNLHAKLEGFSAGGSIKDRAVMKCVKGMLQDGRLKAGDTLAVATSGNAGRSLLHVQEQLQKEGTDINVRIFMPQRYLARDVPTAIAETDGVETIEGTLGNSYYHEHSQDGQLTRALHGYDGEFMDVQETMAAQAKELGWAVLDQHYDANSLHAHESTALEIMQQLPFVTDVVCTTGTGGTASGLRQYLPAHVRVHARPGKPGAIDGITDVRRYSNFCDPELLEGYKTGFFDVEDSVSHQNELEMAHNIIAGQSSGAAYALAKTVQETNPNALVAFICADGKLSE